MRFGTWVSLTLCLAIAMGVAGASAEARQAPEKTGAERTAGAAVGASVAHPAAWSVDREPYTRDGTYGYTLWRPETDEPHDHGGTPAVRVALAYDLEPADIEGEVNGVLEAYPDLPQERQTVAVARKHEGVAVGPIPGSTPFVRVYVPVNGRVYEVNVYSEEPEEEGLDADDRELLLGLRFEQPSRPIGPAGLPGANAPDELYPSGADARAVELRDDAKAPAGSVAADAGEETSLTTAQFSAQGGGEERIAEGCWRADRRFYVQTQHGYKANRGSNDGIPTGWTRIGVPNFWGQYTHGNLGYGRCNEPYYTNDKFAVDYPLKEWDAVFSPFSCGTVTYAGRNQTHADYGIFVSIRACNDKYVNLTGHLVALKTGLSKGDKVNRDTVIGYAGDTGGGNIAVGPVHIHTAFYRYPKTNPDGSPYAGAGLQVTRNRYVGTAAKKQDMKVDSRVYKYDKVKPRKVFCREGIKCGEKYLVSN